LTLSHDKIKILSGFDLISLIILPQVAYELSDCSYKSKAQQDEQADLIWIVFFKAFNAGDLLLSDKTKVDKLL
jgi:hypothetical protein